MTGTVYNGLRERHLHQINRQDGTPCVAYSTPDFFITEPSMFAPKRNGNRVQFFTTGEDYFRDVANAILGAKTSIFITGWQINHDVLLDGQKTLWQYLHQALTANPELKVYVMPWLSPSASVMNTYDFETMLAIFQLNAGLENGPRAFCTPAIQQSDMSGLGATFSHHQKSVVIDNRIGYVGGIDLAYGRCDNNRILETARLENYLQFDIRLDLKHPEPAWLRDPSLLPAYPPAQTGGVAIQTLRSAASNMLRQEQRGRITARINLDALPGFASTGVQANCKSAMLQTISSAQHFIYIESQFFQSDFGAEGELYEDVPLSGPMSRLRTADHLPRELVERVNLREALEKQDIWLLDWAEIDAIARNPDPVREAFLNELRSITALNAKAWASQRLGPEQNSISNNIGAALADRIGRAIDEGRPFHVYMVLPVHPEGPLNEPTIMHQVHLTMQSLAFGEKSLIKRIQQRMAIRAFMDRGDSLEEAKQRLGNLDSTGRPVYEQQDWSRYLTLLNLRTWDELDGQVVTEQIYVHSKLLIADDRVAILGSANINDRSLLGPRDSELAVIVRDGTPVSVALDGKCEQQVSKAVHELRVNLWKKHFGLSLAGKSRVLAAAELKPYLAEPAAEQTWMAIQALAQDNSQAYEAAFNSIPQNRSQTQVVPDSLRSRYPNGFPASIWPTWIYTNLVNMRNGGRLAAPMPFEENFWRNFPAQPPIGIAGFICQLPARWTHGENNNSGINKTVLANIPSDSRDAVGRHVALANAQSSTEDPLTS